jgi:hypothetical protein
VNSAVDVDTQCHIADVTSQGVTGVLDFRDSSNSYSHIPPQQLEVMQKVAQFCAENGAQTIQMLKEKDGAISLMPFIFEGQEGYQDFLNILKDILYPVKSTKSTTPTHAITPQTTQSVKPMTATVKPLLSSTKPLPINSRTIPNIFSSTPGNSIPRSLPPPKSAPFGGK